MSNFKLHTISPSSCSARLANISDREDPASPLHRLIRPSGEVTAVRGADGPRGRSRVSDTKTEDAGRPEVRSRTWQVIGSRAGAEGEEVSGVGSFMMTGINLSEPFSQFVIIIYGRLSRNRKTPFSLRNTNGNCALAIPSSAGLLTA